MAWWANNLNESLFAINTLYAIIGHGIFQYPIGRHRVLLSLVYSIIMGFLFYSMLVYTLIYTYKFLWTEPSQTVTFIILLVQYGKSALAQILSWYNGRKFIRMMSRLSKVDETLQKLGGNLNHKRARNMEFFLIIYWLTLTGGLNILQTYYMAKFTSLFLFIVFIATLTHPAMVNVLVALYFSLTIRILQTRFHVLNELIVISSKSYFEQPSVWNFWAIKKINMTNTVGFSSGRFLLADEKRKTLIQTAKHVHLELMAISRSLDKIYGIQMVLEMASTFILLLGGIYDIFNDITGPLDDNDKSLSYITLIWLVISFTTFMIVNRVAESISAEAKRTSYVIHRINSSSNVDDELHDEIKQFTLQMMNDPLVFSPLEFFTLGYPFVRNFIGLIVTYLVILVQMQNSN